MVRCSLLLAIKYFYGCSFGACCRVNNLKFGVFWEPFAPGGQFGKNSGAFTQKMHFLSSFNLYTHEKYVFWEPFAPGGQFGKNSRAFIHKIHRKIGMSVENLACQSKIWAQGPMGPWGPCQILQIMGPMGPLGPLARTRGKVLAPMPRPWRTWLYNHIVNIHSHIIIYYRI